jgi:transcriptional regulator with XRE-family HTH domain
MARFGEYFKAQRLKLGLTLRAFCEKHGLDPSNTSKIERGLLPPPQGEKLREYARHLGLKSGTNEWYEFCDLAAAEAGRLPADLHDEELAGKLPIFFRTLRESAKDGGRDSADLLKELIEKIRKA